MSTSANTPSRGTPLTPLEGLFSEGFFEVAQSAFISYQSSALETPMNATQAYLSNTRESDVGLDAVQCLKILQGYTSFFEENPFRGRESPSGKYVPYISDVFLRWDTLTQEDHDSYLKIYSSIIQKFHPEERAILLIMLCNSKGDADPLLERIGYSWDVLGSILIYPHFFNNYTSKEIFFSWWLEQVEKIPDSPINDIGSSLWKYLLGNFGGIKVIQDKHTSLGGSSEAKEGAEAALDIGEVPSEREIKDLLEYFGYGERLPQILELTKELEKTRNNNTSYDLEHLKMQSLSHLTKMKITHKIPDGLIDDLVKHILNSSKGTHLDPEEIDFLSLVSTRVQEKLKESLTNFIQQKATNYSSDSYEYNAFIGIAAFLEYIPSYIRKHLNVSSFIHYGINLLAYPPFLLGMDKKYQDKFFKLLFKNIPKSEYPDALNLGTPLHAMLIKYFGNLEPVQKYYEGKEDSEKEKGIDISLLAESVSPHFFGELQEAVRGAREGNNEEGKDQGDTYYCSAILYGTSDTKKGISIGTNVPYLYSCYAEWDGMIDMIALGRKGTSTKEFILSHYQEKIDTLSPEQRMIFLLLAKRENFKLNLGDNSTDTLLSVLIFTDFFKSYEASGQFFAWWLQQMKRIPDSEIHDPDSNLWEFLRTHYSNIRCIRMSSNYKPQQSKKLGLIKGTDIPKDEELTMLLEFYNFPQGSPEIEGYKKLLEEAEANYKQNPDKLELIKCLLAGRMRKRSGNGLKVSQENFDQCIRHRDAYAILELIEKRELQKRENYEAIIYDIIDNYECYGLDQYPILMILIAGCINPVIPLGSASRILPSRFFYTCGACIKRLRGKFENLGFRLYSENTRIGYIYDRRTCT